MSHKLTLTLMIAVIACFNAGCSLDHRQEERFEKTIPFVSRGQIELVNVNGRIIVTGSDQPEVKISALKSLRARDRHHAAELFEKFQIQIQQSDSQLKIETTYPSERGDSNFWNLFRFLTSGQFSVEYELTIPRQAAIQVRTTNGRVQIDNVTGSIQAKSTNGRIDLTETSGQIEARTTNGSIKARVVTFQPGDDLELHTTNGKIHLELPADTQAAISAKTTNGGINTDFAITTNGTSCDERIEGTIGEGSGGGQIRLHTTNGRISIHKRTDAE
ncbi:DUF4097 family beta strand repeat-containing protein [candidate division KSB1 bacterium]|nr:DUF4097 family beta strand repeat-containing protein [candidate division KSB1 bacterium]